MSLNVRHPTLWGTGLLENQIPTNILNYSSINHQIRSRGKLLKRTFECKGRPEDYGGQGTETNGRIIAFSFKQGSWKSLFVFVLAKIN